MEILLARHAEPAWAPDGISTNDPGLTDRGREQAMRLADRLASRRGEIAEVLITSARRTAETAAPIAAALGLEPAVVPGLTEIQWPDWEGAPSDEVERQLSQAYQRPLDDWWDGMPGGETFRRFHERVTTSVVDLLGERGVTPQGGHLERHVWEGGGRGHTVLVVGHAGTNACALGFLLGLEPTPWEWERFVLHHASLTHLKMFPLGGAHIFSLRASNDVEHLPQGLRTR